MPLETDGFDSLMTDIAGMASRMDADGSGAPVAKRILEAAAQPIHQQMKANATKDPRRRSGDLHDALKVGSVRRSKKRGRRSPQGLESRRLLPCVRGVRPRRPGSRARASLYPSRL